jgi:Inner membrane component of T3SS, cytoplasmic domain
MPDDRPDATLTMSLATRITASLFGRRTQHVDVPVVGLRVLPHGPVFAFESFQMEGNAKRILVIGAAVGCDILLDDATVSGLHCLLERHGERVLVHDCQSKNGTRVNGVALQEGELTPGSLLTVGRVSLVAYGPDALRPRVTLAATSLDEFLQTAVKAHGSLRSAAEALGLPYSTLRGWLKKRGGGNGTSPR